MSKNKLVFSIGLILLVMPLLGFPPLWKNFFSVVFGLVLVTLSFSVAAKRRASARKVRRIKEVPKEPTPIFVDAQQILHPDSEEVASSQEEDKTTPLA